MCGPCGKLWRVLPRWDAWRQPRCVSCVVGCRVQLYVSQLEAAAHMHTSKTACVAGTCADIQACTTVCCCVA